MALAVRDRLLAALEVLALASLMAFGVFTLPAQRPLDRRPRILPILRGAAREVARFAVVAIPSLPPATL
jgi:hypothetical protein